MKNKIIIIVPIILAAILCLSLIIIKSNQDTKPKERLIIEYNTKPAFGTEEAMDNFYFINVYDDKTLSYGFVKDTEYRKVILSEEDYNKIVDLAYSKSFQELDGNISDPMLADGTQSHIKIYNKDNTIFKTGGFNPNNELFNKLVSMLRENAK